jgi:hypothetical protein
MSYDGNSQYHIHNGELLEKILEELVKMNESLSSLVLRDAEPVRDDER